MITGAIDHRLSKDSAPSKSYAELIRIMAINDWPSSLEDYLLLCRWPMIPLFGRLDVVDIYSLCESVPLGHHVGLAADGMYGARQGMRRR